MADKQSTALQAALDQVERFRFALRMCAGHAQQPNKVQACQIIVQQVEGAFRIEKEMNDER